MNTNTKSTPNEKLRFQEFKKQKQNEEDLSVSKPQISNK